MKKIKGKLVKRSSSTDLEVNHHSVVDWTKYDERLIECVKNGDVEKLRVTLGKKGTSAIKVDPNGTTALHTACLNGNIECLDVLLEEQPDLSFLDKSGCSPLHVAAQSGNTGCVKRILKYKVHIGTQDGRKMTALHHAAAKGHMECTELLVNNSAPLNGKDKDGRTPLLMAIQGAHEDVVKLLLERGAKVNIADNSKKTALMYASLLGLSKNVEMLLKRGANPQLTDSNDHTAEDYARLCGYQEIIDLIHSAPSVANWDAGESSEDTEKEDETSAPAGEAVSEFSSPDESEGDISNSLHNRTISSATWIPRTVNNGSLSAQESFSSKASTTLSSSRAGNQDLSDDIKELEEENEMLNQELNKLRVQYHKTLERLRSLEAQQESKNSEAPVMNNHVNGNVEEQILEEKEKKIEELEKEIKNLTESLAKEKEYRNDAEDEIATLKAQVASYQDDNVADFNSSENDEDIDLPGINIDKLSKHSQSGQLISLHGQITTLKLENETLREQLKQHSEVNGDFLGSHTDIPAIPLTVYQQLKESNEDEIFKLMEELEELKIANESLQRAANQKGPCPQCKLHKNKSSNLTENETEHHLATEVKQLKHQLKVTENEHRKTLNVYRLHLLNAYQHEMDPQIQEAIQMIIKLRSSEQFC